MNILIVKKLQENKSLSRNFNYMPNENLFYYFMSKPESNKLSYRKNSKNISKKKNIINIKSNKSQGSSKITFNNKKKVLDVRKKNVQQNKKLVSYFINKNYNTIKTFGLSKEEKTIPRPHNKRLIDKRIINKIEQTTINYFINLYNTSPKTFFSSQIERPTSHGEKRKNYNNIFNYMNYNKFSTRNLEDNITLKKNNLKKIKHDKNTSQTVNINYNNNILYRKERELTQNKSKINKKPNSYINFMSNNAINLNNGKNITKKVNNKNNNTIITNNFISGNSNESNKILRNNYTRNKISSKIEEFQNENKNLISKIDEINIKNKDNEKEYNKLKKINDELNKYYFEEKNKNDEFTKIFDKCIKLFSILEENGIEIKKLIESLSDSEDDEEENNVNS